MKRRRKKEPPLETYYDGDAAFARFAATEDPELDREFARSKGRAELIAACGGDARLARVIFHHLGDGALEWMDEKPPVLEGLSPRECLKSRNGARRLRTALMRFP